MLTKQEKHNVAKIAAGIGAIVGPCAAESRNHPEIAEVTYLFTEVVLEGAGRLITGRYETKEIIKEFCEKVLAENKFENLG